MDKFVIAGSIEIDLKSLSDSLGEAQKKIESSIDGMEGVMSKVGSALKWGMVALGGTLVGAVKSSDDMTKSLNSLQVQSGSTNEEMAEYKDIMLDIYGANYGESFDDVANSIAQVRTNLWLSGEELQNATEYALGFRDAFGVEVNESTRAAKALMDNFGVSTEEAFNMLVQGQQEGLDYSGEFIDTITEYSSQFKKLGFNVEDMFSILDDGVQAGAWNLDKIGDAVKELSIRVIDGSDSTKEGFELIGLNADEMASKFANGGDSAKEAFSQVIEGLKNCDDPLAQNLAGTDLLGTMWEDLGAEVVTSLSTANDYFDKTYASAKEINTIQYNSFGEAITGIGRQIQTGILIPIGEKVLPICNEFATWLQNEGVPKLKAFTDSIDFGAVADTAGKALRSVLDVVGFLADNMNILIPILSGVLGGFLAFKVITGILKAIEIAQAAVNLVMSMNPIALLVIAIGALIAIGVALWQNWDTVKAKCSELWASLKEKWNSIKESISSTVEGTKSAVVNKFNDIKNGAIDKVTSLKNSAVNKFNELKEGLLKPVNIAKDKLKGVIDTMKGFFNFNWKLPSIKLPHFSVKGSKNPIDWISEGVPKISVDWYAKGAIFTKPTILPNGVGVGDANNGKGSNPEAILPIDKLKEFIKEELQVAIALNIDGKEFVREVVAPHQNEFDNYNLGRY